MSGTNVVRFTPFAGYSNEWIAEVCAVSVRTVEDWRSGHKKPSAQAMKLFRLHADRRVLGPEWSGWLINRDTIVDPEGNATTHGQLRAYALVYQLLSELVRGNSRDAERLEAIKARAAG